MIKRIACTVDSLWGDRRIVNKVFQRNNEIIKCKTTYFNFNDYFRHWTIIVNNKKIKELSCLYENKQPILESTHLFNYFC